MATPVRGPIRIPSLQYGQITDEKGFPSDAESAFRQGLITSLQNYVGDEGLVMPTQDTTNMLLIQNHQQQTGAGLQYTCAFGTMLYNETTNKIMVAVDGGGGVPLFKEVQLI